MGTSIKQHIHDPSRSWLGTGTSIKQHIHDPSRSWFGTGTSIKQHIHDLSRSWFGTPSNFFYFSGIMPSARERSCSEKEVQAIRFNHNEQRCLEKKISGLKQEGARNC
jgi:hypothetical protein